MLCEPGKPESIWSEGASSWSIWKRVWHQHQRSCASCIKRSTCFSGTSNRMMHLVARRHERPRHAAHVIVPRNGRVQRTGCFSTRPTTIASKWLHVPVLEMEIGNTILSDNLKHRRFTGFKSGTAGIVRERLDPARPTQVQERTQVMWHIGLSTPQP